MYILKPYIFNKFPEIVFGFSTKFSENIKPPYFFNLSYSVGDNNSIVDKNRNDFFESLGLSISNVSYQRQIHSDIIHTVDCGGDNGESDALITNKKNLGLAVSIADCTPVFIYDVKNKIIGAIHSGWRGTESKIVEKTLVKMMNDFNSKPVNLFAYIGPSISQNNYEVLAFDAPAHGISEGKTVNAIEYCNMIQKINETYGPIDCYVAHSFGGLAVCLALEKIPHSENTVLALIAPAAETTTAIKNAFALLKIHSGKIANLMTESIIEKTDKTPEWFSIRRAIKNIHSPILWVQDSEDYITPMTDVDKVINDQPANVRFYITHGLGHQKIYRNHKVVEDIVLFSNSILQEKNT